MSLWATTLLADNTEPMLAGWVDRLRSAGVDVAFDREQPHAARMEMAWAGEIDLLFACGLITIELIATGAALDVVATPLFEGEVEPVYRSVVVARADEGLTMSRVDEARLAVNEYGSWSGWHGWKAHLRARGSWPADGRVDHVCTGGHVASIEAVLDGRADVAAIDHTVWNDWVAGTDRVGELTVIGRTEDWPAPPVSVSSNLDADLRDHIVGVLLDDDRLVPATGSRYEFMLAEQARR